MKAAITVLRAGLSDLRWYIETIEMEWALLAAATADPPCSAGDGVAAKLKQHVGMGVPKRQFDYNSIVITLYGLLEQFIEALVRSYAANLNLIVPRYADLPEAIRNSHVELSFTLLNRSEQSRFRGMVTPEVIIANLHSCLSSTKRYSINIEAFCLHGTNFRAEAIDELFGRIGIGGVSRRLHLFPAFAQYLGDEFPDRDSGRISHEEKFFYLSDLAERRNEVAHGSVSELLSNDLLLEYIKFIDAYAQAIYQLTTCHFSGCQSRPGGEPLSRAKVSQVSGRRIAIVRENADMRSTKTRFVGRWRCESR